MQKQATFTLGDQSFRKQYRDPKHYLLSERLINAVDVALALGQPLLITGEPGTGKTQLAYKVAQLLHQQTDGQFSDKPFEFFTKTTAISSDLFYTYDALSHFHDANLKKSEVEAAPDASKYIELNALGKAIALTNQAFLDSDQHFLSDKKAQSSVVLLDEIDKAPRDFPNDILNEIETFNFRIKEMGNLKVRKGAEQRIIVIMTSNSEKNLPDAFLRRCVFYHIPFPKPAELFEIVAARMEQLAETKETELRAAIGYFNQLREKVNKKKPATAELLAWLHILQLNQFFEKTVQFEQLTDDQKKVLHMSLPVLLKNKDDLALVGG